MIPAGMITELIRWGTDLSTEAGRLGHQRDLVLSSPLVLAWDGTAARIGIQEVVARTVGMERSGLGHVSLVSGWRKNRLPLPFYQYVDGVRKNTGLAISVDFGAINMPEMVILKEIGVSSVCCALPAKDARVLLEVPPRPVYQDRLRTLREAGELGLKTGVSLTIGIGESFKDIDAAVRIVEKLGIDSLSVSGVWPATLTAAQQRYQVDLIGRIAAAARLCLPDGMDIAVSTAATAPDPLFFMECGANVFTVAPEHAASPNGLVKHLRAMWQNGLAA
ncbi:MAG: hypothetical protein WC370_08110 [Dehalococcoidales bacterium]|jgi:biotin synthase-like enzyme